MSRPEAIPAATLIVLADRAEGTEVLMVERTAAMVFAAEAAVFPGGRVDPDDRVLGARIAPSLEPDDAAARIAAIRETLEETGLAIGFDAPATELLEARAALSAGRTFSALAADAGWRIDLAALTPWSRWEPPGGEGLSRRFDTRFYLAAAPSALPPLSADGAENHRLFWATATEVLARADAGALALIFPTRRNLERLAQFARFAEADAHARALAARKIVPWVEWTDGAAHLCIPADRGYPITREPLDTSRRG